MCFSGEDSGQMGDATGEPRVARRSWSRHLSNALRLAGQLAASQKDSAREVSTPAEKSYLFFYFYFIFPRYRPAFGECCVCSLSLFRFEI